MRRKASIRLILASASPRRKELLRELGIPFRVKPSHIPEHSSHRHPRSFVQDLALQKASAVAESLSEGIVLGADTVVVLRGRILGKPKDEKDAHRMLSRLSGSTHRVYTGVALVEAPRGRSVKGCATSVVRMKRVSAADLLKLSRQHLDKAGSYAIQEKRDPIARVIKGSYDNVVGLPVGLVKSLLQSLLRKNLS